MPNMNVHDYEVFCKTLNTNTITYSNVFENNEYTRKFTVEESYEDISTKEYKHTMSKLTRKYSLLLDKKKEFSELNINFHFDIDPSNTIDINITLYDTYIELISIYINNIQVPESNKIFYYENNSINNNTIDENSLTRNFNLVTSGSVGVLDEDNRLNEDIDNCLSLHKIIKKYLQEAHNIYKIPIHKNTMNILLCYINDMIWLFTKENYYSLFEILSCTEENLLNIINSSEIEN